MSNLILPYNFDPKKAGKSCLDFKPLPDGTLIGDIKYCARSIDHIENGVLIPGCKMIDYDENGNMVGYKAEWYITMDIYGELICAYFCTGMLEKDKGVDDKVS